MEQVRATEGTLSTFHFNELSLVGILVICWCLHIEKIHDKIICFHIVLGLSKTVLHVDGPDNTTLIPATETYTRHELSPLPSIACFCGTCNPMCNIEWTVNGTYISNDSILTLGNVTRNTTGQYVCTCTNPSTQKVETQQFNLSVWCKYIV